MAGLLAPTRFQRVNLLWQTRPESAAYADETRPEAGGSDA